MKKMLILLMGILLVISACEGNGNNEFVTTTPFLGGSEGLKINFIENFPPTTVGDGGEDSFDIIVEVSNRGEHVVEAEEAQIRLTGFSAIAFGKTVDDLTKNLPDTLEANEKAADGTPLLSFPLEVSFDNFNYQGRVQGNQQFPLRAEICYKYTTTTITNICIKEDFRRDEPNDLCQVAGQRTTFNSGGPIQITSARQSAAGAESTRVTFRIENKDVGRVFEQDSLCQTTNRNQDRVFVRVNGLDEDGEEVSCNLRNSEDGGRSGDVVLGSEGYIDVTCTISVGERTITRPQTYSIELSYNYQEHIQTSLIVENS